MEVREAERGPARTALRYPPLLSLVVAMLIAVVVLPSSLTLPQSPPSETLEFAPIPPEDSDDPPPPAGDLSSLGLATSQGLDGDGALGGDGPGLPDPPLDAPEGVGKSPRTKRCVNTPEGPRQTEDPLAPPCVADFRGDNFGETYQGVTREEVRILVYVQGFTRHVNTCADPNQVTPDGEYFDLGEPPSDENEHCLVRVLRTWQQYFNERYQTYDRFVRFFVYFSGAGNTPEERRADAADNFNRVRPFAVLSTANSFGDAYLEVMARRGVLNFGSFVARGEEFFQQFPRMIWGYLPSLEKQAEMFAGYVCTKVAGHPVSVHGNAAQNGNERVFGYWSTSDEGRPELQRLARLTEQLVSRCGVEFAAKHTFPSAGYVQDNRYSPRYATTAIADFQSKGVTTIIWPGGLETNFTKQAAQLGYTPEIIALGDGVLETETSATFQDQAVWDGARIVTNITAVADERQGHCYLAYREADPDSNDREVRANACDFYPNLRQLFTGIQVAGPRLGPTSIDRGFRAIPAVQSEDPQVPACFYDPGDYTCVKDAMAEYWDSAAQCWRMVESGQRYFSTIWPEGNVDAQDTDDDPCNAYDGSFLINPAPPSDPGNL